MCVLGVGGKPVRSRINTGLHDSNSLVLGVMRYVGSTMEEPVDPVSAIGANHAQPLACSVLLNDRAKVAVCHSWLAHGDRLVKTLSSRSDQILSRVIQCSNCIGRVQVAVESVMIGGNVNIDDIPVSMKIVNRQAGGTYFNSY